MTEHALNISFVPDPDTISGQDRHWLTISEVDPDDAITLSEAAELVDSIFDIVPCEDGPSNGGLPADDPTEEEFAETIKNEADLNVCGIGQDGTYTATLKIVRSHLYEPYSLKLSRGYVSTTRQFYAQVEYDINVREQSSIVLDYPIYPCPDPDDPNPEPIDIDITWLGNVYDELNQIIDQPGVDYTCSTLNFGQKITATIRVKYGTQYDLVDVTVPGIGSNAQNATARCFYCGLIVKHDIQPPETDDDATPSDKMLYCIGGGGAIINPEPGSVTCYENVDKIYRCKCSGDEHNRVTVEQDIPCPEGMQCPGMEDECRVLIGSRSETAEYVDCGEITGDVSDPEYYEEICCHPPEISLPRCEKVYAKNNGGAGIEGGVEYWKQKYGNNVRMIAVSPKDGDCGTTTYEQDIKRGNCCDGVSPLEWDKDNSVEVIGDNSSGLVYVSGGRTPLTVKVRGDDWWLDAEHTIRDGEVENSPIRIYTGDVCGVCTVTVSDGCSSVSGTLRSADGHWELLTDAAEIAECVQAMSGQEADSYTTSGTSYGDSDCLVYDIVATDGKWKIAERLSMFTNGDVAGSCPANPEDIDDGDALYAALLQSLADDTGGDTVEPVLDFPGSNFKSNEDTYGIGLLIDHPCPLIGTYLMPTGGGEYAFSSDCHPYSGGLYDCICDQNCTGAEANICEWSRSQVNTVLVITGWAPHYYKNCYKWVC